MENCVLQLKRTNTGSGSLLSCDISFVIRQNTLRTSIRFKESTEYLSLQKNPRPPSVRQILCLFHRFSLSKTDSAKHTVFLASHFQMS